MASTFPRWRGDTEPRFVESLCFELARSFNVVVLVPHCKGAASRESIQNGRHSLDVRRFRYFLSAFESLAYEGGMLARVRRNPLRLLLLPFFLLSQLVVARRLIRQNRIDAIHAHWIIPQGLVAAALRSLSDRTPPVLTTSHGGDLFALRGRILEALKRWTIARADTVTVVSAAMRDYCGELGVDSSRIRVRSMGVDLESTFTPPDGESSREGLVFVGRLVEKKGVVYLVEAMSILANSYPTLKLTVVGDGPLLESTSRLSDSLGLGGNVRFAGSVTNEEVPSYLRSAAIAVMPSVVAASGDQEGLGLVAVEALGCGCAVVASDLPAVRDTIIDGQTGLMARPADAVDLAAKIARLLDDAKLRETLAEQGRRYAIEHFNWRAVGTDYVRIINDMISGSRAH